jgi:hypothetical protein
MQQLFVSKAELIRILGPGAWRLAMFMANGTQEGTAVQILFNNIPEFNLVDPWLTDELIPMLVGLGGLNNEDLAHINSSSS